MDPQSMCTVCTQFRLKSRIRFQAKGRGLRVYHGNLTTLTRWVSAGGIPQGNTFPLEIAGNDEKAQMKMPSIHIAKAICSGFLRKFNINISLLKTDTWLHSRLIGHPVISAITFNLIAFFIDYTLLSVTMIFFPICFQDTALHDRI